MFLRIGYELQFDLSAATHLLLLLHTHPGSYAGVLQRPGGDRDRSGIADRCVLRPVRQSRGAVQAAAGKLRISYDNVAVDTGEIEPRIDGQRLHPLDELPNDVLPYLLSSRYCEVDRLSQFAWDLFGNTPATHERVLAVMDWVHSRT